MIAVTAAACVPLKGRSSPRVLLVGDSIAYGLAPYLGGALAGRPFQSAAVAGCGIIRGRTYNWDGTEHPYAEACDGVIWGRHEEFLHNFDPDVVVWLGIVEALPRGVDFQLYTPGTWAAPPGSITGPAADAKIIDLMNEAWGHLTSRGARLAVLTLPPPTADAANQLDVRTAHLNNLLMQFAAQHPENTAVFDLASLVCPPAGQPPCDEVWNGVTVRTSDFHVHFTPEAAALIAPIIANVITG
jgi:hypothetical protein